MRWQKRDREKERVDKGWHLKFAWTPTQIIRLRPFGFVMVWLEFYWRSRLRSASIRGTCFWKRKLREEAPLGVATCAQRSAKYTSS